MFLGLKIEGEGFLDGGGVDLFGNFKAADNFMLLMVGKRVGEKRVKPFVDAGSTDDLSGAKKGT